MKRSEIAVSKWDHRESTNRKNTGINQARAQRISVKAAAAINAPAAIDIAHWDLSVGKALFADSINSVYLSTETASKQDVA